MDFFASQDRARKKTGQLVALFALGVAAVVVLVYLVIAAALMAAEAYGNRHDNSVPSQRYSGDYRSPFQSEHERPTAQAPSGDRRPLWDPRLFALVAAGTVLIIGAASWYRVASLQIGRAHV